MGNCRTKRSNQREDRLNTERTDEGKFLSNLGQNTDTLEDKQESHWSMRPDSSRDSHMQLTLSGGPGLDSMSPQVSSRLRKKRFYHKDKLEQGQGNLLFFKKLKWQGRLERNKIRTTSSSWDMKEHSGYENLENSNYIKTFILMCWNPFNVSTVNDLNLISRSGIATLDIDVQRLIQNQMVSLTKKEIKTVGRETPDASGRLHQACHKLCEQFTELFQPELGC